MSFFFFPRVFRDGQVIIIRRDPYDLLYGDNLRVDLFL